jgi:cob(I)alamin adenosyltransferase
LELPLLATNWEGFGAMVHFFVAIARFMAKFVSMTEGLIHIYTGEGKGKTTSSVGLAVRSLGHGRKVVYAYFHKIPENYGYNEINMLKKLGAQIFGYAKGHPYFNPEITNEHLQEDARRGLKELQQLWSNEHIDLMILDEVIIAVRDGFLDEQLLLDFLDAKPSHLELVITGRAATEAMMERADYVSEIMKRKHPFDRKIMAREAVEY